MPEITLTFPSLNFSAQIGDIAYYTLNADQINGGMQEVGGFDVAYQNSYTLMGNIINIIPNVNAAGVLEAGGTSVNIVVDMSDDSPAVLNPPQTDNYVFFIKDHKVNVSSLVGYYGEVEFRNDSSTKAEMFAASCEISESSK
tara:strand:+ start:3727 stop:4152 length:426 start_codon:yes stop_codon:yes gene_type:complete